MAEEEYDFIFKVLLLGNSDVGKSSLLLRYVDGTWSDSFVPTIGVDFKIKTMEINSKKVKMQIWDTAGQERFRNVISSYFRGGHGILLIYDVTDRDSFKNLGNWLIEIEKNANKDVLKILIGNKCDLEESRVITTKEGTDFANSYGMKFFETSAKNDINVSEAFQMLARQLIEINTENKKAPANQDKKITVSSAKSLKTKKGCC